MDEVSYFHPLKCFFGLLSFGIFGPMNDSSPNNQRVSQRALRDANETVFEARLWLVGVGG